MDRKLTEFVYKIGNGTDQLYHDDKMKESIDGIKIFILYIGDSKIFKHEFLKEIFQRFKRLECLKIKTNGWIKDIELVIRDWLSSGILVSSLEIDLEHHGFLESIIPINCTCNEITITGLIESFMDVIKVLEFLLKRPQIKIVHSDHLCFVAKNIEKLLNNNKSLIKITSKSGNINYHQHITTRNQMIYLLSCCN
jgi:hypothetical protein